MRDAMTVDAAIKLESEGVDTVSMDQSDTQSKAQIRAAITLISKHVHAFRQRQLTSDMMTAEIDRTISGGRDDGTGN